MVLEDAEPVPVVSDPSDLPASDAFHAHLEAFTPRDDTAISPTVVAVAVFFNVRVVLGLGDNDVALPMVNVPPTDENE